MPTLLTAFGEVIRVNRLIGGKLAYYLIHNAYNLEEIDLSDGARRNMRRNSTHELISAPPNSKWTANGWSKVYRMPYQQHNCSGVNCKRRVRSVSV